MKKVLGVGTFYLMITNLAGVLSSYLINVGIARYLGPALFGIFGVLMSLYQLNRAFFQSGVPKAASKYLAENPEKADSVMKTSLQLQLTVAVAVSLVYIVFSNQISSILHDNTLREFIIFIGIMVIPQALLFLFYDGYLNGQRLFKATALHQIAYAVLRVILVFAFLLLGWKIFGALLGYLVSSILALILALCFVNMKKIKEAVYFPRKNILAFTVSITAASFCLLLMRNIDTLIIKSILRDNVAVGIYTAAMTLANIPYIAFSALPLTLLPSVSKSVIDGNVALTRKYINQSLRYLLMSMLPVTALIAATSTPLVAFLYSSQYIAAGPILFVLTFSSAFLVLFVTLGLAIAGSGKPNIYLAISLAGAILLAAFAVILVPSYGIKGAAIASLIAAAFALLIAGLYVYRCFGFEIKFLSLLRILLVSAFIYFIAHLWQPSGFMLVVSYALLLGLYFLLLFLFGEITTEDQSIVKNMIKSI